MEFREKASFRPNKQVARPILCVSSSRSGSPNGSHHAPASRRSKRPHGKGAAPDGAFAHDDDESDEQFIGNQFGVGGGGGSRRRRVDDDDVPPSAPDVPATPPVSPKLDHVPRGAAGSGRGEVGQEKSWERRKTDHRRKRRRHLHFKFRDLPPWQDEKDDAGGRRVEKTTRRGEENYGTVLKQGESREQCVCQKSWKVSFRWGERIRLCPLG